MPRNNRGFTLPEKLAMGLAAFMLAEEEARRAEEEAAKAAEEAAEEAPKPVAPVAAKPRIKPPVNAT